MPSSQDVSPIQFSKPYKVGWFDMDANGHMGHTSYAQFAGQNRIDFMDDQGITQAYLSDNQIGPILFEECLSFRSEVMMGETLNVDIRVAGLSENCRKIRVTQDLYKEDGTLACRVQALLSWLDMEKRKVVTPPEAVQAAFTRLEKTEDYQPIA